MSGRSQTWKRRAGLVASGAGRGRGAGRGARSRRGVASVLAMMFLVLFGSLVAAMAIASRSNIRTASTHVEVLKAMNSAETGMVIGESRLNEAVGRFIVSRSAIDQDFAEALWEGSLSGFGDYTVLASPSGVGDDPAGIAEALVNIHALDTNIIVRDGVDLSAPGIVSAWPDADVDVYRDDYWVATPIIALESQVDGDPPPAGFQLLYAPLTDGATIRVISIGYDFVDGRDPMTRTITKDFRLSKSADHAVLSPARVMVGKNVQIVGDLGASYDDLEFEFGDPLIMRSDFRNLHPVLDAKLEALYAVLSNPAIDVDGDNRLRVGHPVEGAGIPGGYDGDDGDPEPTATFSDATGDGYVDEYDVFINHFDTASPKDNRVHIATEFVDDDGDVLDADLAELIDGGTPDRNENGVWGFADLDGDGVYEPDATPAEAMHDWAWVDDDGDGVASKVNFDQELGYLDGYLDDMDRYVKLNGQAVFRVSSSDWETAQPSFESRMEGAIRAQSEADAPRVFGADLNALPDVDATDFTTDGAALIAAADGDDFWTQVANNLGVSVGSLGTYTETQPDGATTSDGYGNTVLAPRFFRLDADADGDGLPDNWETAFFEPMPLDSPNVADWYYRPVFENMIFRDVVIPVGLNGLFDGCTFVGVTRVETHTANSGYHAGAAGGTFVDWSTYGRMALDPDTGRPAPERARFLFGDDPGEYNAADGCLDCPPLDDTVLPEDTLPPNAFLSMALDPMDKGDVPLSHVGGFAAGQYDALPDPLIIERSGTHYRVHDSRMWSNNVRLHDCMVVGSIAADTPLDFTHVRNKVQFTGATKFVTQHPTRTDLNPSSSDLDEILKSSLMLPNFSVDIGSFNSPESQDVQLQGAIIAGMLDVRGNATIDGSLILTFRPEHGQGPLADISGTPIGNPAGFNTSLGYFGPSDGEFESLDPWELPTDNGVPIVGWDVNADGFVDVVPPDSPTQDQLDAGATAIPFNGFGRIRLRFDPDRTLPDGIMLPLKATPVESSYREGKL